MARVRLAVLEQWAEQSVRRPAGFGRCCSSRVWIVLPAVFLPFQEAAVKLGGLLLHPLQHRHAFPGHPQRLGQGVMGSRCRWRADECRRRQELADVRCRQAGPVAVTGGRLGLGLT